MSGAITLVLFPILPLSKRFSLSIIPGFGVSLLFVSLGGMRTLHHDIRELPRWFGHSYTDSNLVTATIDEPLVVKPNSYKTTAVVDQVNDEYVKGKVIIYFAKDSLPPNLQCGDRIVFEKTLQPIRSSGNPGGFDFRRYCLFQGITHQVYLKTDEFSVSGHHPVHPIRRFILASREWILKTLRENISGRELGLAEALLIGYRDDLDKTLVQSYTNTGVVHVIAISGLHLGLIYWLLLLLFKTLDRKRSMKWIRLIAIITGLWIFSLLAGAQPSVLRSALMFSCIALGETLERKTYIFNSLACSAFILLCINPFWLWDLGFQLSYSAVLSIVLFMKPVYHWLYFRNKALDFCWQLTSVTIAAQLLTTPVSIFHFHQFPNYFLLTNFVAVPLSSIVLIIEIALCIFFFIPFLAINIGHIIRVLLRVMNGWIEKIEALPYSLSEGLQITLIQTILLTFFIIAIAYWLLQRSTTALISALIGMLGFATLRSVSFIEASNQNRIIIYNVPKAMGMDFVNGRHSVFIADSAVANNPSTINFNIQPARTMWRFGPGTNRAFFALDHCIAFGSTKMLIADGSFNYNADSTTPFLNYLLVTGNPNIRLTNLIRSFRVGTVIFDASNTGWKVEKWKNECDSAAVPNVDIAMNGAFVITPR